MDNFNKNTIKDSIENIIAEKYKRYAKYIILDRALPDVRDGLKPVQRRILYALYQLNLTFDKPFKKCAKVVGEVIGKYHPHGDASVYSSMVRMSQSWKMLEPLLLFQGNNGSNDGDPPAAMRYTEVKLNQIANYMLLDLKYENITKFIENFDDTEHEPIYLPSFFPNLLVNGAMGIATGYATEIPSHNLNDVIQSLIILLKNKNNCEEKILRIIKGPDFPTSGKIEYIDSWKSIFENGVGRFYLISDYEIDETNKKHNYLVIKNIPYNVVKSSLVKQIDFIYINNFFEGLLDVSDESDRFGTRIVIKYSKKVNTLLLLNYLCKNTQFRIIYNCNYTTIIDNSPKTTGIYNILNNISEFHKDILKRKYKIIRETNEKRMMIIDALIIIAKNIKDAVALIMKQKNKMEAKNAIMLKYSLNEVQAESVINLRLYRLTSNNVEDLINDRNATVQLLEDIDKILNNTNYFNSKLINIYNDIATIINSKRKTQINYKDYLIEKVNNIDHSKLVKNISKIYIFTNNGYYIKQSSLDNIDKKIEENKLNNQVPILITKAKEKGFTILLTQKGQCIIIKNLSIPNTSFDHLNKYIKIDLYDNEIIWGHSFNNIKDINTLGDILITTINGKGRLINKDSLSKLPLNKFTKFIVLDENDIILNAVFVSDKNQLFTVSKKGYINNISIASISKANIRSKSVNLIKLKKQDNLIKTQIFEIPINVIVINNLFMKKIINSNDFPITGINKIGKPLFKNTNKYFVITFLESNTKLFYIKINNKIYHYSNTNYNKLFALMKKNNNLSDIDSSIYNYNISIDTK